jgi:hypothetical protein
VIPAAFVLAVMAAACFAFWVGVPLAMLWGLGQLTDDRTTHFVAGLIGVPLAMVLFANVLFWLNGLYLRVTGVAARREADLRETGWQRRAGGPLEPMLFVSLAIAIVAVAVGFVLADNSPPMMW